VSGGPPFCFRSSQINSYRIQRLQRTAHATIGSLKSTQGVSHGFQRGNAHPGAPHCEPRDGRSRWWSGSGHCSPKLPVTRSTSWDFGARRSAISDKHQIPAPGTRRIEPSRRGGAINVSQPCLQFDYVVVGGGWANCAIAARLSERSNTRIARVEADGEKRHEQSYDPNLRRNSAQAYLAPARRWRQSADPTRRKDIKNDSE
jgi:hypothetical protein